MGNALEESLNLRLHGREVCFALDDGLELDEDCRRNEGSVQGIRGNRLCALSATPARASAES